MPETLTDEEWDDLVGLIAQSPPERIGHALQRLHVNRRAQKRVRTTEGWLLHLAMISSGAAFERALLEELRRLSLH